MVKEKRKKRIVLLETGEQITTVRTYRRFKKFLLEQEIFFLYDRSLKTYNQTTEVIFTEAFHLRKRKIKKEVQEPIIKEVRIRKQVVINYRGHSDPYAISIRAVTINPNITERGLLIAVLDVENSLKSQYGLHGFNRTVGFEKTPIPPQEDSRLNDYRVHVEVLIKKNRPIIFIK